MLSVTMRFCVVLLFCLAVFLTGSAQTPREGQKPKPTPKAEPTADPTPSEGPQDIETLKIDTDLVTVPVIVTDASGLYVPDLHQADFSIAEDGVKQEIAFFGTVSAPFHVILMLDTSASSQEKLRLIQQAANAFVEQLQAADRVKVISFDDDVRDRNDFTSDRAVLRAAINDTRPGKGTKVYDAMELALNTVRRIQGRKAIVIFTDGVDWHSDQATFNSTVRGLDEEGVIVYPIRYDTRAVTEQIAREQSEETTPQLPTIDVIRRPTSGTTPPTFPSDDPLPTSGTDDSLDSMLDMLYSTADSYLETLANKSGGKLLRADTLGSLPDAFAKIAAELRTQYLLGYYPINKVRDERYRKIKVTSARKNVFLRARPGYHAPSGR